MKWYSYSYSEPQAVSSTRTSTAQAEYEYDNAVISGFGQHLVVVFSEKSPIFYGFRADPHEFRGGAVNQFDS